MITNKYIRNFTKPRTVVEEYIGMLKESKPNMSVIDVGGGINSWCTHTTHVVDIFVNPGSKEEFISLHPERVMFNFDITQRDNWSEVLKYVEENGKFDYSICTHTLEDIPNPVLVCEMLQKISRRGFISVPSKYAEYLRFETWYGVKGYRGFFHHKWIYSLKNNVFTGFEKANYWEHLNDSRIDKPQGHFTEIGFMWEDSFDYKFYHSGEVIGCHTPPVYPLIFETDDLPLN
jgi:hypothetical protein